MSLSFVSLDIRVTSIAFLDHSARSWWNKVQLSVLPLGSGKSPHAHGPHHNMLVQVGLQSPPFLQHRVVDKHNVPSPHLLQTTPDLGLVRLPDTGTGGPQLQHVHRDGLKVTITVGPRNHRTFIHHIHRRHQHGLPLEEVNIKPSSQPPPCVSIRGGRKTHRSLAWPPSLTSLSLPPISSLLSLILSCIPYLFLKHNNSVCLFPLTVRPDAA